jgi:hypothetical protein
MNNINDLPHVNVATTAKKILYLKQDYLKLSYLIFLGLPFFTLVIFLRVVRG